MPWKQSEESPHMAEGAGYPGTEEPGETHDQTAYGPSGCHTERKVELLQRNILRGGKA